MVSARAQPAHVPTQPQLHPGLPVSRQCISLHPDRGNPSQGQTSRQTFNHTHPYEDWLPGARNHGAGHGHEPTEVRSWGHSVEQNSTQGQFSYCSFLCSSNKKCLMKVSWFKVFGEMQVVFACFCMNNGFLLNKGLHTWYIWNYCIWLMLCNYWFLAKHEML